MQKHKSTTTNRKSVLSEAELSQIEQAAAEYDWETVRDLTAEALNAPDLAPAEEFDLRWHRAKAFDNLWDLESAAGEMQQMLDLSRTAADDARAANALNMLAFNFILVGKIEESGEAAHEARALATTAMNPQLEARALNILGWHAHIVNEPELSETYRRQALALAENGVSPQDETWALRELRYAPSVRNDPRQIDALLARALRVARAHGDRLGELYALSTTAQSKSDLAQKGYYMRQARDLARQIDNRGMISILNNNLANFYSQFGLFQRAYIYAQEAVQFQQKSGAQTFVLWSLGTLAQNAREAGEFTHAQQAYTTLSESASQADSRLHAAFASAGLGRLALDEGQYDEAQALLETAVNSFEGDSQLEDKVNTLVWLAAAFLARDELEKAREISAQAMAITAEEDFRSPSYPLQDLWLMRYRVLTASADNADNNETWAALDEARLFMLEPIANMGDEGLRRNYLNKVPANRAISETWAREATIHGLSLAPFTEREATPASVAEQMQRIVESGARLASERDVDKLAEFILQEFVELSGVERAGVGIRRPGKPLQWAAMTGISEDQQQEVAQFASPFIQKVSRTLAPLLVDSAGEVLRGDVPELHRRSAVVLPMISQGKLWGVLYGDMRHLFGRLNENDRDILSLLANQAGAALENASWVETLEQQVRDRTAELAKSNDALAQQNEETQRRNAELAVINAVQKGLAAQLDMQAIFDLVGNKIYEIFGAHAVSIMTFDYHTSSVSGVYGSEDGSSYPKPSYPFGPGNIRLINEKSTLYMRSREELKAVFPDWEDERTSATHSLLMVPLIVRDEVFGSIDLQDERPNAYKDSDVRLLTTLANSMGVALENARLYSEAAAARAQAESANEAKSAFISNISHELRTPLNAIMGFTRIVKRKTEDQIPQKQTENLDKVLSSGEHLLGLINTILDIAKIESGRMDVIVSRFHIGQLIEATMTVSQPLLRPDVDLNLNIALGLPEINSDQDKIKQILLNLLSNAAKFTHEGSITVSANQQSDALIISVADTGIGMNEEALGRVFEEFQQADPTTRKEYGGTGLGMPISRHLAQLLGGNLTVASTEGEGSTFTLTLPIESGSHS